MLLVTAVSYGVGWRIPGSLEQGEVSWPMFLTSVLPTVVLTAGLWIWFSLRENLALAESLRGRP
ncbi:hypothetical protein CJ197_14125 [Brachybacterium sp. UMB0905]|nr:hypothetical protein CJ197_14125 [Brachybacterium sp. UMB0905]